MSSRSKNLILNLINSLRPKQWSKNVIIFAGLIFSRNIFDPILGLKVVLSFVVFCLLSGCIYLINDIVDLKQDQQHPLKRQRPIAAGKLSASSAKKIAMTLLIFCLLLAFKLDSHFALVCSGYAGMMFLYTIHLKKIVILDVIVIALGFVLRALAGTVVIHVEISPWLLVCTLFAALFLALSKRRHEIILLGDSAIRHRTNLLEYNSQLLDLMITVATASTILTYALYTLAPRTIEVLGTSNMIVTIPFVIFGIFRYLYLVYQCNQGGTPEILIFSDRQLMINLALWIFVVILILYL